MSELKVPIASYIKDLEKNKSLCDKLLSENKNNAVYSIRNNDIKEVIIYESEYKEYPDYILILGKGHICKFVIDFVTDKEEEKYEYQVQLYYNLPDVHNNSSWIKCHCERVGCPTDLLADDPYFLSYSEDTSIIENFIKEIKIPFKKVNSWRDYSMETYKKCLNNMES
jgi:hypothetical protein